MIELKRIDPCLLDRWIEREMSALREIEIEYLLLDAGPLLHQVGRPHGIFLDPLAGVVHGLDEGNDDLRIFLGEVLAYDDAVKVGNPDLAAVIDLPAGAAIFHDFRP